jgi:hypothetical protein
VYALELARYRMDIRVSSIAFCIDRRGSECRDVGLPRRTRDTIDQRIDKDPS